MQRALYRMGRDPLQAYPYAMNQPLQGRVIAVPETRQLDVLSRLLEARGATVRPCPLVGIHDVEDPSAVDAWTDDFIAHGLDLLILLTGEGLRRLHGRAVSRQIEPQFLAALQATPALTRGPKPAAALRSLGLKAQYAAAEPTTQGVIQTLAEQTLRAARVGVQLYGDEPNRPLIDHLESAGATVLPVAPYRYADEAETEQVAALIAALAAGEIDAITFTSTPQVRRLYAVARERGLEAALQTGWERCTVAAVGPVVAEALQGRGVNIDVMPGDAYFIKPLVNALAARLAPSPADPERGAEDA